MPIQSFQVAAQDDRTRALRAIFQSLQGSFKLRGDSHTTVTLRPELIFPKSGQSLSLGKAVEGEKDFIRFFNEGAGKDVSLQAVEDHYSKYRQDWHEKRQARRTRVYERLVQREWGIFEYPQQPAAVPSSSPTLSSGSVSAMTPSQAPSSPAGSPGPQSDQSQLGR